VRRTEFETIGGFDEEYWMYWEDADLCWRIAEQGGHVWFEPAAEADHQTGASGQSQRTVRAFHESASRFYERHLARSWLDASMVRAGLLVRAHIHARRLSS
jgi:GT2 family glycosyltransferase